MTTLSWLIYLISTLNNLGIFLIIIMLFALVATVVSMVAYTIIANETCVKEIDKIEPKARAAKWIKRFVLIAVISGLINVFIPGREYMIMMAGAEVANVAVNQDVVKNAGSQVAGLSSDAINLLRDYIRKQTEELNTPKKSN